MASQWDQLVNNTKAIDIATTNVIKVESTCPLKDVLQASKKNKIQSLPVLEGDNILGFVDVLDVTAYALHLWRMHTHTYLQRSETKFSESSLSQTLFSTPVKDVINFSGRNEYLRIDSTASLADVLKMLSARRFSIHRVVLMKNSQLLGIISQSDILKFMNKHIDKFMLGNMTLKDLNLVKTCIMVRVDRPLIETLSLLVDNKVSGLALVDWEFNLVANFSASDLKGLLPDAFDLFWSPTIDFLRQGTETKSFIPPKSTPPDTKLNELINMMASSSTPIHRVFITKGNRLEGICSLTDIIAVLAEGMNV